MYNYYIFELARIHNDAIARQVQHAYHRLPSTEATLVERVVSSVRAFINWDGTEDGQDSDVPKTDN